MLCPVWLWKRQSSWASVLSLGRLFHSKIHLTVRKFYLTFSLTVTLLALVISLRVTPRIPLSCSGEWEAVRAHQSAACLTNHTLVSHSWAGLCSSSYLNSSTCASTSPDQLCHFPPKTSQICQYLSGLVLTIPVILGCGTPGKARWQTNPKHTFFSTQLS